MWTSRVLDFVWQGEEQFSKNLACWKWIMSSTTDLQYIFKACCLTVYYATIFAYSYQCCFMFDWFVLFVCTVTKEPLQSQFSVWHTNRYTRFCEAKRLFVQGFYFFLPPSLSLPSEQSVSVATSHPSPLHPDWQMQCQTFWSRMHLPLLLQSPGQPSVNTSCTCQTAEQVRARKSGGQGERGRRHERKGAFRVDRGRGGTKMIKDSTEWTYSMYTSDRTGDVGEGVRGYSCFTWASGPCSATEKSEMCETKEGRNLLRCFYCYWPMEGTVNAS